MLTEISVVCLKWDLVLNKYSRVGKWSGCFYNFIQKHSSIHCYWKHRLVWNDKPTWYERWNAAVLSKRRHGLRVLHHPRIMCILAFVLSTEPSVVLLNLWDLTAKITYVGVMKYTIKVVSCLVCELWKSLCHPCANIGKNILPFLYHLW